MLSEMTVTPEGRRLLRLEVRNAQTPVERKPAWMKARVRTGPEYRELAALVQRNDLHTVCQEAGCPNIFECWEAREATFLIGGDQCTRRCDFCQIATGRPSPWTATSPGASPNRWRTCACATPRSPGWRATTCPTAARGCTPRRSGRSTPPARTPASNCSSPTSPEPPHGLTRCSLLRPEVLAHNLETVPRIFRRIRPGFDYSRSLAVLERARGQGLITKSNLILGMGETTDEVVQALRDLHAAGCQLITITQYLRPTPRHHPIERWITPAEFAELDGIAREIGFLGVMSGPLVRSSYRAGALYAQART